MLLLEFMLALKTISEINLFLQWTFLLRVECDDNQSAPETIFYSWRICKDPEIAMFWWVIDFLLSTKAGHEKKTAFNHFRQQIPDMDIN